jgi:hypothetical protein
MMPGKRNLVGLMVLTVALWLPTSCEDFLDKPVQGQLLSQNFPTSAEDAVAATNAVYNTLRKSSYHFGLFPLTDIMSDDARKGSNPTDAAANIGPYDRFQHIPTESSIASWWNCLYEGIRRANVVIEKVPPIAMNSSLQQRLVAEARFLRALYYFDLVRAWGDVPKVTAVDSPDNLTRSPRQEIYELIVSDLMSAAEALPEKSQYPPVDMGRATKGAAKSLLAKVYLFQNDFTNAEKYALEVISSGEYSLTPDFADANSKAGEFGPESVFEIGAIGFEGIENGGDQYGNVQGVRGTPNRGWGFNRPSLDLMNTFEANDPRREATVIFLGEVLDGVTIIGDNNTPDETRDASGNLIEIEVYNQKVWTPGVNVPTQFDHNRRLIRYADVLLIAAEASNQNNKPAQALQYVNQVRARARGGNAAVLPDLVITDKSMLDEAIFHERRVEFALEGHRFWDLVRTNRAEAVLGPLGFVKGKHELFPIPQVEIDLTKQALEQNPNWK